MAVPARRPAGATRLVIDAIRCLPCTASVPYCRKGRPLDPRRINGPHAADRPAYAPAHMPEPSLDIELPIAPAEAPRTHSTLAKVLASAPAGHHGLAIDVTDDNRVVGTWLIELHPRDARGTLICNARARLEVCASMCGDARSNNAFLVITQWPTNVTDRQQQSQLYLQLCQGVLARLDTVAGRLPAATRMPR